MRTHPRWTKYFTHSPSDQYCISLLGWGLTVVQENSILLCIIVEKAFHSHILRAPGEELHAAVWGQCSEGQRQIYTACLTHYKPVSHGDSKLWVCTGQVLFCFLFQRGSPSPTLPREIGWQRRRGISSQSWGFDCSFPWALCYWQGQGPLFSENNPKD